MGPVIGNGTGLRLNRVTHRQGHQVADLVQLGQLRRHRRGGDAGLALPRLPQQGLDRVGQVLDVAQAQHPRRPLEAVGLAKDLLQQGGLLGLALQLQQAGFDFLGMLHALGTEHVPQLPVLDQPGHGRLPGARPR